MTEITFASDGITTIPLVTTPYPQDIGALLLKIEVQNENELYTKWTVVCSYDSKFPDPTQTAENPLDRPAKWTFGFSKYQQAVQYDYLGNAFQNSACQPFDPPYEVELVRPTIEIEQNVSTAAFSYAYILGVMNKINAATWNGYPAQTVKCDSVGASLNWENGIQYWALKYGLSVQQTTLPNGEFAGWNPVAILDAGVYQRACNNTSSSSAVCGCQESLVVIRDNFGAPVTAPVLLNGSGQVGTTPTYLYFYPFQTADFSAIPL